MPDMDILRLQYEILNVSVESIAKQLGLPPEVVAIEIEREGWKPLWPNDDETPLEVGEGEDAFELAIDKYISRARKRLMAYALAKEMLLAQKYLQLELGIVDTALQTLKSIDSSSVSAIKTLASLYRDMCKNSLSSTSNLSMQTGLDEQGLPTVIIKDLSGHAI